MQNNADSTTTEKLIDYFFTHQEQFTEEVLLDYTLDNFLNELAALVASLTVNLISFRKLTSRPCVLSLLHKAQLTTGPDITGNIQLGRMEFPAHQSLVQMERGSTGPKNGDSMNGLASLKHIRVDSSLLIISILIGSLLLLAKRQGLLGYSSIIIGWSLVVLCNVGLEIVRDLRDGIVASKGTIFAGVSL